MRTKQEAFTIMVNHLRKQGRQSWLDESTDSCAYKSDNGDMCAVGALIGEGHYNPEMESQGASDLDVLTVLENSGWDFVPSSSERRNGTSLEDLLMYMQNIHDSAGPEGKEDSLGTYGTWEEQFSLAAALFGLKLPLE